MSDTGLRVGDVVAFASPEGYRAAQITAAGPGLVAVRTLRGVFPGPPATGELSAGTLLLDHHATVAEPAHHWVTAEPAPPDLLRVGRLPVPAGLPPPRSYGSWLGLRVELARQHHWDRLPAAARDAYRAAAGREPAAADPGRGPVALPATVPHLDLTGGGPVRWSALARLPRVVHLSWAGPDRGLCRALAAHPMITSVDWHDPPPAVDLTGSALLSVRFTGTAPRDLRLPAAVGRLTMPATDRAVRVRSPEDGRWTHLFLDAAAPGTRVPDGIERVPHLSLSGGGTLPAAALPGLRTLGLRWGRRPGLLTGADALAAAPGLAVVEMHDAYGLTAGTLPDLPALTWLGVRGVRGSAVAGLRARYRGTRVRLELSEADEVFPDSARTSLARRPAAIGSAGSRAPPATAARSPTSPGSARVERRSHPGAGLEPAGVAQIERRRQDDLLMRGPRGGGHREVRRGHGRHVGGGHRVAPGQHGHRAVAGGDGAAAGIGGEVLAGDDGDRQRPVVGVEHDDGGAPAQVVRVRAAVAQQQRHLAVAHGRLAALGGDRQAGGGAGRRRGGTGRG